LYNISIGRETKSQVPKIKTKKFRNRLDKFFPSLYNGNNEANTQLAHYKEAGNTMGEITVGSQFTTQKSGVSGIVQEIVKNANGSFRVRLDVAGQPRWTTVVAG
jgi:hypothetical protein